MSPELVDEAILAPEKKTAEAASKASRRHETDQGT